jgi:hypothetical protein
MLQESPSISWDIRNMTLEPFTPLKIYILFWLVACIATSVQLINLWRFAPPFRVQRQSKDAAYISLLQSTATSLDRWIRLAWFAWGIFGSISVFDFCNRVLDEKMVGRFDVAFFFRQMSTTLTMALLVALFAFLVQWHISRRVEDRLRS